MKNKTLIGLDSRQAKIVASVFELLSQKHIDLARFCTAVCSNAPN